ncbi:MAG: hypothetical protein HGA55_04100 [Methanoregulaceae archaeon]|nr:hypothetical protein [Methanoregulaceae archaeon]
MPEDYKRSLLKDISDQKEKDMENPRKESMPPATPEERISALEKKVRDQDALIKGLTEEFLDLKSITMRLNKFSEQRPEVKVNRPPTAAVGGGTGTVVVAKRPVPTTAARAPPPPEPDKMEMIMQPDGTLKPEKRKASSDYIVASAAYSKKGKQQNQGSGKKSDLIVAEDEEKDAPKK